MFQSKARGNGSVAKRHYLKRSFLLNRTSDSNEPHIKTKLVTWTISTWQWSKPNREFSGPNVMNKSSLKEIGHYDDYIYAITNFYSTANHPQTNHKSTIQPKSIHTILQQPQHLKISNLYYSQSWTKSLYLSSLNNNQDLQLQKHYKTNQSLNIQ